MFGRDQIVSMEPTGRMDTKECTSRDIVLKYLTDNSILPLGLRLVQNQAFNAEMNADYLMNAAILLLPKEDRDKIADAHIGPKFSKILSHNGYILSAKKQSNQLLDYHKKCQEYRHGYNYELVPKKKKGSESVGEDYISTVCECDSRIRVHCSRETDSLRNPVVLHLREFLPFVRLSYEKKENHM
jgi:hypothetical protein